MRRALLTILALAVTIGATAGTAQAVVVDDAGTFVGAALVPGGSASLGAAGLSLPHANVSRCDPWLTADLSLLPQIGLCWHGGPVLHAYETFALTWDQTRTYWAGTRDYVEQFLKDVADGSGTLTSPYAVTSQYVDSPTGRAMNQSKYGGACIDYGDPGGYTCQFGNTTGTGVGHNYPTPSACAASITTPCLTDADVRAEVAADVTSTQLTTHLASGYQPLVVLLTPPNIRVCVDANGMLCSADGKPPAPNTTQFCSYHSFISIGPLVVPYVVQPWTVGPACDESGLPALGAAPTAEQQATDAGTRIVSPLSQSEIATIVNPQLNGWFAEDHSEIDDNGGCEAAGVTYDKAAVGNGSQNPYYLAPEFSNAGVIDTDPGVPACAHGVVLKPAFVVPSAVGVDQEVQLDGSTTNASLIVPKLSYSWDFGDGTTAIGPSVVHTYAYGGTYAVKLTVTDRGGYTASITQNVTVLGPTQPGTTQGGKKHHHKVSGLQAHMQLMPQGLRDVLRHGVATRVTSNRRATGIVTLSIPRGVARRAHIHAGRGAAVVVGRGTVSQITAGTVSLHLHLSRAVAGKLEHLRHVALTVRLALVASGGDHLTIDAAGRY
jgi:hypothetical protein